MIHRADWLTQNIIFYWIIFYSNYSWFRILSKIYDNILGIQGLSGIDGMPGLNGLQGVQGEVGFSQFGLQGEQGLDGDNGFPGSRGLPGFPVSLTFIHYVLIPLLNF